MTARLILRLTSFHGRVNLGVKRIINYLHFVDVAVHLHRKAGEITKLVGRSKTTVNDLKIIATLLQPFSMESREWRVVVFGSTGNGDDTDDEDDDQYIDEDDHANVKLRKLLESNMNSILNTRGVKNLKFDGAETRATMLRLCTAVLQSLTYSVSTIWIANACSTVGPGTSERGLDKYDKENPKKYNPTDKEWLRPFDVMGENYYRYSY